MYINSYIISKYLKGITEKHLISDPLTAHISGIAEVHKEVAFRPDTVFVGKSSFFVATDPPEEGCTIIVIGEIPLNWKEYKRHDILALSKHASIAYIIDQVLQIITKYNEWEQNLLAALIKHRSLSYLCKLSIDVLGNPMMIHGKDFELLGIGEDADHQYTYEFKDPSGDFVNPDVVDMLITDPQYPITFTYTTPHFYDDKWDVLDIYQNIFINQTYVARLVVDSLYEPLSECDFVIIIKFCEYIQHYMELYPNSSIRYLQSFKNMLISFTKEPENTDKELLINTLKRINWKRKASYICAWIEANRIALSSNSIEFQCGLLENTFHNCIAMSDGSNILAIFYFDTAGTDLDKTKNEFSVFIREQVMHAGFSAVFDDFLKLPQFCLQAKAVLNFGKNENHTLWIHTFDSVKLSLILKKGIDVLPGETLVLSNIKALIHHDIIHKGHLYETFKVYMEENMNIQKSINRLFIHRSTFNYRLSKIEEYVPENFLESFENRLYILMTLSLSDNLYKTEQRPE